MNFIYCNQENLTKNEEKYHEGYFNVQMIYIKII